MTAQNRSTAVMAARASAPGALDFFPTPPWATRALCEVLVAVGGASGRDWFHRLACLEPAAGEGHMVRPLREYFGTVEGSDIHDYGCGFAVRDFLPAGFLEIPAADADWVITNPPFNLAEAFALRGLEVAGAGVALLVRTAFLESAGRHERLFGPYPPNMILQFTERVPMVKGRLDPKASSATAYCWIVWLCGLEGAEEPTEFWWIPPCRKRLERPGDYDPPAPGGGIGEGA